MKSLIGLRIRMMLLALGIASLSASSVVAQQIDAEHSTVQILMGSNSDANRRLRPREWRSEDQCG